MIEMVEQVLLLGQIESGAMHVKRQVEDVSLLCRSIVDEVDLATQQRCNLEVDVVGLSAEATTFALDANLLRSALGNLLGNAVKYSTPGATVTIAAQVSNGGTASRGGSTP